MEIIYRSKSMMTNTSDAIDGVDDIDLYFFQEGGLYETYQVWGLTGLYASDKEIDMDLVESDFLRTSHRPQPKQFHNSYLCAAKIDSQNFLSERDILPQHLQDRLSQYLNIIFNAIYKKPVWHKTRRVRTIEQFQRTLVREYADAGRHMSYRILAACGIDGFITSEIYEYSSKSLILFNPALLKDSKVKKIHSGFHLPHNDAHENVQEYLIACLNYMATGDRAIKFAERLSPVQYDPDYRGSLIAHIQEKFPDFSERALDAFLKDHVLHVSFNEKPPEFITANLPTTPTELAEYVEIEPESIDAKIGGNMTSKLRILVHPKTGQHIITKENGRGENKVIQSEYEAYQIYRAFGVTVPQTTLIKEGTKTVLVMPFIIGQKFPLALAEISLMLKHNYEALYGSLKKDWPIDALLGNPDTGYFHFENLIIGTDQNLYRIDMGFALEYDAYGEKKNSILSQWSTGHFKWNKAIRDFYHLRFASTGDGKIIFSSLTNQEIYDRLLKAQESMPAVKQVASAKNYHIINGRLKRALKHFSRIIELENAVRSSAVPNSSLKSTAALFSP